MTNQPYSLSSHPSPHNPTIILLQGRQIFNFVWLIVPLGHTCAREGSYASHRCHHVQERAICKIVELMTKHISQEPRTLFVMGSYRIGKERAYLGAAKAMGFRCHVNADKLRVSHAFKPFHITFSIYGFPLHHM